MIRPTIIIVLLSGFISGLIGVIVGCGRAPSDLLRQGQSPVFDFPMYLSEGANGRILKYNRDGTSEVLVSGLNNPLGIATDKANNLFVVESGENRLLKVNTSSGEFSILQEGLDSPSVVAVDSFGEVYILQQGTVRNILRISDQKIMKSFLSPYIPTSLAFGVEDIMIVGVDNTAGDDDFVEWTASGNKVNVNTPSNISTDATGRVFVSENTVANSRIFRYHQRGNDSGSVVADGISAPSGIAVDPVGNIYVIEQGAARIVVMDIEGQMWEWASGIIDPQYLAFTQY